METSRENVVILANAINAKLKNPSRAVKLAVNEILTYEVEGAKFSDAFKIGRWDGTSSFFKFSDATFPAGFLYFVAANLKRRGYQVTFCKKPLPKPLGENRPAINGYKYDPRYEYQYTVTEKLLRHGQIVFRGATGSGKTLVSIIAFKTINRPTLFLTTRSILMYQMKENFEKALGSSISMIGDGEFGLEKEDGSKVLKKFTVATVQTVCSYLKDPDLSDPPEKQKAQLKRQAMMKSILEKFEFVILEEGHESSATGWFELLKHCKNAYYRLALTGTPFMRESKEMNMRLMASSGPVALTVSEKQLIDCGILATPYFKYVKLGLPKDIKMRMDWRTAYRKGVVENQERNLAILKEAKEAVAHGLSVMILFKELKHGATLKRLLDQAGIKNRLIEGANDQQERKVAIEALKNRQIDVLLGSTILDVGVDVPAVGMVIIASGGKAEIALRQRIGRGLRAKKTGANVCFVVDFADTGNRYLIKHAEARKQIVQSTKGFGEHIVEQFDYSLLELK